MPRKTYRADDLVWVVTEKDIEALSQDTLGQFLDVKKMARKSISRLLDEKLVLLNGKKATPKETISVGDEIRLQMEKEKIDYEPIEMDLSILYEDEDILLLDKPSGITVNSKGQVALANGLAHYFKENKIKRKIRFVNRLDRDTHGCVMVAKSGLAQSYYQQQIESNELEKWYEALVWGSLEEKPEGVIDLWMTKDSDGAGYRVVEGIEAKREGKITKTGYRLLGYDAETNQSRLEVRLYTGRTHQIRVALAHIGHSLVGDALYDGYREEEKGNRETFSLWAKSMVCTSLRTGERITITSEAVGV